MSSVYGDGDGLACKCGGRLFGACSLFQTFPDGRCFELANDSGTRKTVWLLSCLACSSRWLMSGVPHKDHKNKLLVPTSPEALALLEKYTTDGIFTNEDAVPTGMPT
jgi:hypothetical protein